MKTFCGIFLLLFAQVCPLFAQPAATNHVLELDGNGSYVELPPNIFNNFDEATVEAWVKWRSFAIGDSSRFFSYGELFHDTGIQASDNGTLSFFVSEGQ